jgi:hypothetical protein
MKSKTEMLSKSLKIFSHMLMRLTQAMPNAILTQGCPSQINFEEMLKMKAAII